MDSDTFPPTTQSSRTSTVSGDSQLDGSDRTNASFTYTQESGIVDGEDEGTTGRQDRLIFSRVRKTYTTTTATTVVTKRYAPNPRVPASNPDQGPGLPPPVDSTTRAQPHVTTPVRNSTPQPRTNTARTPTHSAPSSSFRDANSRQVRSYGIQHPRDLPRPPEGSHIRKFYLVTAGSQVGIFFSWPKTQSVTSGISGNSHNSYNTWDEALTEYTNAYSENRLRVLSAGSSAGRTMEQTIRHPFTSSVRGSNSDDDDLFNTFDEFTDAEYDQIPELCERVAHM